MKLNVVTNQRNRHKIQNVRPRLDTSLSHNQAQQIQEVAHVALPEMVELAYRKKRVRMYTGLKCSLTKRRKRKMIRLIKRQLQQNHKSIAKAVMVLILQHVKNVPKDLACLVVYVYHAEKTCIIAKSARIMIAANVQSVITKLQNQMRTKNVPSVERLVAGVHTRQSRVNASVQQIDLLMSRKEENV